MDEIGVKWSRAVYNFLVHEEHGERRLKFCLSLATISILAIYLFNNILLSINQYTGLWEPPYLFPLMDQVGADFRAGYYYPAIALLQGKSPYIELGLIYPPFSALFSLPFTLFQVDTAYRIQVVLLYVLNLATIFFCH